MKNGTIKFKEEFLLESGESLNEIEIFYSESGKINEKRNNVIWVCHALTANSDVESWWDGMVGKGKFFDTDKYYIICANIIGSCYGSTGPLSNNPKTDRPFYSSFPLITIRDIVNGLNRLRIHLNINSIYACIGGSLGGQQALEWAIMYPDLIQKLVLMASNAQHSPWGIALNESQRMAIRADQTSLENNEAAGIKGLAAARSIALLSYRNYEAYSKTQLDLDADNKIQNYKAISYQTHQGEKLVKRFNCQSYVTLTYALDSHNVGRGRGGLPIALAQIKSQTLVVSITSDILFPPCEQILLAQSIPNAQIKKINSIYGHDGFLIENKKLGKILKDFFAVNIF